MRGEYIIQNKAGMKKCYVCLLWRRDDEIKMIKVKEHTLKSGVVENELYKCSWDCPGYSEYELKLKRKLISI